MIRTIVLVAAVTLAVTQQAAAADWPKRVLLTNDNGIDDPKLIALARAFSRVAETYVAAPSENRSGGTHYVTVARTGKLSVKRRDLGEGIVAYAVDGFPGDCVVFGIMGLLKDKLPDLVISGINGGPNLSAEWIGSGTIGAARLATLLGIPAVAISGLQTGDAEATSAATQWTVQFSASAIVRQLRPGQYLTVSIPRKKPSGISGVEVARRSSMQFRLAGQRSSQALDGVETWSFEQPRLDGTPAADTDVALYDSGRVVVVPMHADEHDEDLLVELKKRVKDLPPWPSPAK